jgi:PadR family transcriptional regulator AphA
MDYVILGLLILRSQTLYELNTAFKQGISLFYSASYGSLQATIKNLLKNGLIEFEEKVDNGRNKKEYSITARGQAAFFQWMCGEIQTSKLEVTALSKVYFLGLIDSTQQKKAILGDIIQKIEAVEAELAVMDQVIQKIKVPDAYLNILEYQVKTLDYGIQAHRCAKEWFVALLDNLA